VNLFRRLAPARGILAALLVFVASSATNMASAGARQPGQDEPAFQTALALHAPVAQRTGDDQRTQRRVPQLAYFPFADNTARAVAEFGASPTPAGNERPVVVRAVPRAYDATAPPASHS
jgi:hypothetical protein